MAKELSITDQYKAMFGEAAPIFGYTRDEWLALVLEALNTGKEMRPKVLDIPPDTVL